MSLRSAREPSAAQQLLQAGSGFGGQTPLAFPNDDMVVVVNAWNIPPVRAGLPRSLVIARMVSAIVDK